MTTTTASNGRDSGTTASNSAQSLKDAATSQVADIVEQAQDGFDKAVTHGSDEFKRLSDQSTKFVRENPAIALAGAAGVGLLIGLAVSKRR
ncbi:hypothetical protein [uncultured Tateyamaria sp.]|uniref:hypothetical protein n=1 Tax=Tateyamaria sp. 1078 TaxID=3417464 RepID=UPI00261B94DA|nr:hypothetical protein [uncultured Tateyamaria sp.]